MKSKHLIRKLSLFFSKKQRQIEKEKKEIQHLLQQLKKKQKELTFLLDRCKEATDIQELEDKISILEMQRKKCLEKLREIK